MIDGSMMIIREESWKERFAARVKVARIFQEHQYGQISKDRNAINKSLSLFRASS